MTAVLERNKREEEIWQGNLASPSEIYELCNAESCELYYYYYYFKNQKRGNFSALPLCKLKPYRHNIRGLCRKFAASTSSIVVVTTNGMQKMTKSDAIKINEDINRFGRKRKTLKNHFLWLIKLIWCSPQYKETPFSAPLFVYGQRP